MRLHTNHMYIRVHAVPEAKREKIIREDETTFTISVKEPAQQNFANKRIREILAEEFDVPLTQIILLTGHQSRSKMYSVGTKYVLV